MHDPSKSALRSWKVIVNVYSRITLKGFCYNIARSWLLVGGFRIARHSDVVKLRTKPLLDQRGLLVLYVFDIQLKKTSHRDGCIGRTRELCDGEISTATIAISTRYCWETLTIALVWGRSSNAEVGLVGLSTD